ncbi:hypothetical protein THRCLA_07720 [Thraustotheca clavata]|uniref:Protein kinase domain-containing protein n=1 Tax=Thraustotheca clavata TaxID=74557 RepID=A0A1V9ZCE0_9STRA|nr:hypothetical protein THRCLA_07720 [Thraustotheca clavata]
MNCKAPCAWTVPHLSKSIEIFVLHIITTTTFLPLRLHCANSVSFVKATPWVALCDSIHLPLPTNIAPFTWPSIRSLYTIASDDILGTGCSSDLLIGFEKKTKQQVAIKRIKRARKEHESYQLKDIRYEISSLRALRGHPNVVQLCDYFLPEDDSMIYLVFELAQHGDLLTYLKNHAPLDEAVVQDIMRQLLAAVESCHSLGIIHRDIKLENTLVTAIDGNKITVKLADFGFAVSGGHGLTRRCGSFGYMAPEMQQNKIYGSGVDVWSLGVVAYNLLTMKMPEFDEYGLIDIGPEDNLSENAIDFLLQMLHPTPSYRASATSLQKHPWLQKSTELKVDELAKGLLGFLSKYEAITQEPTATKHMQCITKELDRILSLAALPNALENIANYMVATLDILSVELPMVSVELEAFRESFRRITLASR